jgi:hypothetical protein
LEGANCWIDKARFGLRLREMMKGLIGRTGVPLN